MQKRVKQELMPVPTNVIDQLITNCLLTGKDYQVITYMMCETYGYWRGPDSGDAVPWVHTDEVEVAKKVGLRHWATVLAVLRRLVKMNVLEQNKGGAYRINERTEEWKGDRLHGLTLSEWEEKKGRN